MTSQDGATLPGVTVTISGPDTGLQRTTVTSTSGEYKFGAYAWDFGLQLGASF